MALIYRATTVEEVLHRSTLGLERSGFAYHVKVLCAVGDFGNVTFNLPQKPNNSTNVQLKTIAPIAQNTCYKLAADY